MKKYLNRTLVVEGKEDASYLSNYIESEIVVVNGFEISKSTISYLKNKPVILLLDPDEAGKTIRQKLKEELTDFVDVEIDINRCNRGKKNGIAECEIDEILEKIAPFCSEKPAKCQEITVSDLLKLGLDDKKLRKIVCDELNLGVCNNKQLLKRLEINNIKIDDVCEIIKRYKNGNK